MFTGIIEEVGQVKAIRRGARSVTIEVSASVVTDGTQVGDSICTNGVCLTATAVSASAFTADVMPETVARTSLASLKPGSRVNLERALTLKSRLGGHLVSGHIDGTGRIVRIERDDNALWLWTEAPRNLMRYIVEKGSVALQGVSLTVARVEGLTFAVSLIPHTQAATTLHQAAVGDLLNIETDIIAKYTEKLLGADKQPADKLAIYKEFMRTSK